MNPIAYLYTKIENSLQNRYFLLFLRHFVVVVVHPNYIHSVCTLPSNAKVAEYDPVTWKLTNFSEHAYL